MANLGKKGGIYHVRFRYRGKEYKKSLKIRDKASAEAVKNSVELTVHRLVTGQAFLPPGVAAGDFIFSGGTLIKPAEPVLEPYMPSTHLLIEEYKESQKNLQADSYAYSQAMHLRHLVRHLGDLAKAPCDRITHRHLDGYLKARLAIRHPNTAEREGITLMQFYKWVVAQGYLAISPASTLAPNLEWRRPTAISHDRRGRTNHREGRAFCR